jgi:hypothetical protein
LGTFGTLSTTGFKPSRKLSFDEHCAAIKALSGAKASLQWAIGDLWVSLETSGYGERASKARDGVFGDFSLKALMDAGWVCRSVTTSVRTEVLSFTHHKLVAALKPDLQRDWLDRAGREHLSVRALHDLIAKHDAHGMPTHTMPPRELAPSDDERIEGECEIAPPGPKRSPSPSMDMDDAADADEAVLRIFNNAVGDLHKLASERPNVFAATNVTASRLRLIAAFLQDVALATEGHVIEHDAA